ncbi:uncharacterized protein OCT59_002511 [Rhizophagus irregularis]|uniref:uncharacterized protein n=1 Tax=Rhizophagus irregularis TaxID=588596 RepID=UPI00333211AB|nr:hypothetical protein OCT59_002511 [Rhizophagus irregularis]
MLVSTIQNKRYYLKKKNELENNLRVPPQNSPALQDRPPPSPQAQQDPPSPVEPSDEQVQIRPPEPRTDEQVQVRPSEPRTNEKVQSNPPKRVCKQHVRGRPEMTSFYFQDFGLPPSPVINLFKEIRVT